jgi:hypothetical protein
MQPGAVEVEKRDGLSAQAAAPLVQGEVSLLRVLARVVAVLSKLPQALVWFPLAQARLLEQPPEQPESPRQVSARPKLLLMIARLRA